MDNVTISDASTTAFKESSKDGKKFFSLSVKPKDAVKQKPKAKQEDMPEDDIPFN